HAQSSARSARNRRGSLRQRLAHHHQPGSRGPLARSDRHPNARRRHPRPRHPQRLSHRAGRRELAQAAFNTVKSARARWRAHRTLGATRRWTTTGYATAQWKARSARRCPPPPGPTLTNRNFFSFCGGPNPSPLDQSGQAKHHHFDPRKQTPGGRHQIGTPAGFKSESVAGFLLECVAGFVGIRTLLTLRPAGSLNRPRRPASRGSGPASHPARPLVSYQINRQLSGWNLPPPVIRAFGTHGTNIEHFSKLVKK